MNVLFSVDNHRPVAALPSDMNMNFQVSGFARVCSVLVSSVQQDGDRIVYLLIQPAQVRLPVRETQLRGRSMHLFSY